MVGPSAAAVLIVLVSVGCGSSSATVAPTATDTTSKRAAGDIPDTAVYLAYHGRGYSVKYVEGWGIQLQPHAAVTISDKDSSENVTVLDPHSGAVSVYASADLNRLLATLSKFHLLSRRTIQLPPGRSVYLQYQTLSPQDPVTGKRVPVLVDRYYIPGSGKLAVITLATPVGVDNVDAFRLISRSFQWK
jgi:hypothetical protein